MYLNPVFYYTIGYFILGAGVNILISKSRNMEERRQLWLKLGVYFLIVHGIIISLLISVFLFSGIAIAICIAGLYEMLKAADAHPEKVDFYRFSVFIFLITALCFVIFSFYYGELMISLFLIVICFDGFSQLCGQLFGKHKLTPKISPGKTVEGLAGGLFFCIVTSVFIRHWIGFSIGMALISGMVIGLSALTGDLLASYYKRNMGIKDFGTLIPGHGGVLDRFDSLIAAGAVYFLVLFIIQSIIGLIFLFGPGH